MKNEKSKNYQIGDDPGYARKIVFVNKQSNDFESPNIRNVMPIIEECGDEEKFKGFLASTPTIYSFLDNFEHTDFASYYRHQGSLYQRQKCTHPDVVVYAHIMKLDSFQEGSSAGKFIHDLMSEFPGKRSEQRKEFI